MRQCFAGFAGFAARGPPEQSSAALPGSAARRVIADHALDQSVRPRRCATRITMRRRDQQTLGSERGDSSSKSLRLLR